MQRTEVRATARSLLFFSSCSTFLTVLIAFFAAPEESFYQTANLQNAGIGSWFTATNWSTGAVPGNGVNVVVDDGGTARVDTTSATVGNLTIGATTASSTVEVGAGNTLNTATLTVGANGKLVVDGAAGLFLDPGVTITNPVAINNNGILSNEGTIQVSQPVCGTTAAVTISGGGTVTSAAGATIAGSGLIGVESPSGSVAISNSGIISGTEGIQLAGGATITNSNTGRITGNNGVAIVKDC